MPKLSPAEHIASDYLTGAFADLVGKVKETVDILHPHTERFEGIVVRGTSGLLVGPMVASMMNKPWCIVRKPADGSHSNHRNVEGWFGFKTYIIIDDLISTGTTLLTIQRKMREYAKAKELGVQPECVGYYLYNCQELRWRGDGQNYNYYDKYFLFPDSVKRPTIAQQIAQAAATGPLTAAVARYNSSSASTP